MSLTARQRRNTIAVALLALALGLGAKIGAAKAQKVGVAAAVNPDAFSSLSGSPAGQLNIGKSIFYNERISTGGGGIVQVLLVDGSTFTVGPGSALVIDKFVYDPKKQTGEVVATFSKGALRYVGGKISKTEAVIIDTPGGSLAIRGAVAQGVVNGLNLLFSFLFGKEMIFTATNGKVYTVYQPGYTVEVSGGEIKVRPTTPADTDRIMAALGKDATARSGGQVGPNNATRDARIPDLSTQMAEIINSFTTSQIQAQIQAQIGKPEQKSGGDISPSPSPSPTPPITEFRGYATAMVLAPPGLANPLIGTSPSDFALSFDASTQTGQAVMLLRDVHASNFDPLVGAYEFSVPIGPTNASLPGRVGPFSATVYNKSGFPILPASATGFFFVGDPNANALLCSRCDFMLWGVVSADVTFGSPTPFQDNLNGFWVAGDLPTIGQLPLSGGASYSGTTIGTIVTRPIYYAPWSPPQVAVGNVGMNWDFASRTGTLNIANFDSGGALGPLNMSGTMSMTGPNGALNSFQGNLGGSLSGNAVGSFARKGGDPIAGILGNWQAVHASGDYRATAIFGAARN